MEVKPYPNVTIEDFITKSNNYINLYNLLVV